MNLNTHNASSVFSRELYNVCLIGWNFNSWYTTERSVIQTLLSTVRSSPNREDQLTWRLLRARRRMPFCKCTTQTQLHLAVSVCGLGTTGSIRMVSYGRMVPWRDLRTGMTGSQAEVMRSVRCCGTVITGMTYIAIPMDMNSFVKYRLREKIAFTNIL